MEMLQNFEGLSDKRIVDRMEYVHK